MVKKSVNSLQRNHLISIYKKNSKNLDKKRTNFQKGESSHENMGQE